MVKEKIDNESTGDRFKRLAGQRTQAVLDKIRVLGNCANPYSYKYSYDEIKHIFKTIEDELKVVRTKFIQKEGGHKFNWKK